jgi:hypothetical protein
MASLAPSLWARFHRIPARADKRFTDPAWQQNPLLHPMRLEPLVDTTNLMRRII